MLYQALGKVAARRTDPVAWPSVRAYADCVDPNERRVADPEMERVRRPATEDVGGATRFAGESRLRRLAAATGNRAFARTVARMRDGDGILPGGLVHPDVEAAIAAANGRGRMLDTRFAAQAGAALEGSFADVRVHHDREAAALNRAVSARAFTVGQDIFFGEGEYRPETTAGRELLTHELVHVVQQRGAPQTGALTVSQPGDALEREAEAAERDGV
jgi:hypothetical protein